MDAERSNERSALVLLALLRLAPSESWAEAANPMLGTRAIMDFIRDEYGKDYAPNTRESVRRFTLHQFVEAHLVDPSLVRNDGFEAAFRKRRNELVVPIEKAIGMPVIITEPPK